MSETRYPVSRRGLLSGAAVASAVAVAGSAGPFTSGARAAGVGPAPSTGPVVSRERIASAILRLPDGGATTLRFGIDFHERLSDWLAFWSANSPRAWSTPVEVRGRTDSGGTVFTLTGLRYQVNDQPRDGFTAGRVDRAHWATLASLHHHFGAVRPTAEGIRIIDGAVGGTTDPARVEFAVGACRELWGYRSASAAGWHAEATRALRRAGQSADISARSGWAAFTRASLRLGLGTESY